jgi:hypothetical protein
VQCNPALDAALAQCCNVHHISNPHKALAVQVGAQAGRSGARKSGFLAGLRLDVPNFYTTSSSDLESSDVEHLREEADGLALHIPSLRGRPRNSASALLAVLHMESRGVSHTHLDGFRAMTDDTVPARRRISRTRRESVAQSRTAFGTRETEHGRALDIQMLLTHVMRRYLREHPLTPVLAVAPAACDSPPRTTGGQSNVPATGHPEQCV